MGLSGSSAKVPSPTSQPNFAPGSFYSPFGNVTADKNTNSFSFNPNISANDQSAMQNDQSGALGFGNKLSAFANNPDSIYSDPMFQNTYNALTRPLQTQQGLDQNTLNNNLNATNQLGSSNDALQHYYLNKQYGDQYANAANQAYSNTFNSALSGLNGLRSDQSTLYTQAYSPLQYAANYLQLPTQANSALAGYNSNLYNAQTQSNASSNQLLGNLAGAAAYAIPGIGAVASPFVKAAVNGTKVGA
jgi:hypothetical protein